MIKKAIAIVLTFAFLFSFVACASQTEQEPGNTDVTTTTAAAQTTKATTTAKAETTTKATETQIVNPFAEKMEINWLTGIYSSHLYEEGRWDELELEEKFNVDLKLWNVQIDSNNMDQVKMMLAAGDVPDYGFYYTTGRYLYEQGLGRTVPLNLIKQYYPSYYKRLMEDPIGLQHNRVEDKEDEFYGLTSFTCMATHTGHVPIWRLDWLEDLGFRLDNLTPMDSIANDEWDNKLFYSSTRFSIDDVKEILRAFTEDDPDGNGVDDTYGSGFSNTWYDGYISYCMFGYDINGDHFYKDPVTGDYVPFYAYTPYKEVHKYLLEMLDKGYMRWVPGEVSYDKELKAIWATGKTGYMNALSGPRVLGYNADVNEWPPASILAADPQATFVVTPVAGENGKYRPYWTFNWSESYTYPIGINCSDEKLARIFQIIEYSYFGDDWLRYKWGIEGVHYKWAGEPFNSPIIMSDATKIPAKYAGKGTTAFGHFGNLNFVSDNKVYFSFDAFTIQFIDFWNKYNDEGYYSDKLWIRPDKFYSSFTMTPELFEEFKTLRNDTQTQINTVRNDFTKKIWAGQVANIDSEWEQYIEQIYAAGLDRWVEIWNSDEVKTYQYFNSLGK